MSTINDLILSEYMTTVHAKGNELDRLCREGKEQALFKALSDIEVAARSAQERLNDLKYGRQQQWMPPVEMASSQGSISG